VLDEDQHIQPTQQHGVDVEEVASDDPVGLLGGLLHEYSQVA
jgi:hypothetical protein